MKINWKVRFRNPVFITQIIIAIGAPLLAYFGLTAQDLTTWGSVFNLLKDALLNPYVLGLIVANVYNAIPDPVTAGFGDSKRALGYYRPKKEGK